MKRSSPEWEEARRKVEMRMEENRLKIERFLEEEDMLDEDGYPTEYALFCVQAWPWNDQAGWFEFIKSIWHLRNWGWSEGNLPDELNPDKMVYTYHISTAGWSGNESIIRAMEKNDMLWHFTWVQSRRGGHYIFENKTYE